jgi:hypothetical protein
MSFTKCVFYGVAVLRIKKMLAVDFDLIIKFINYFLHGIGALILTTSKEVSKPCVAETRKEEDPEGGRIL